ncbi:MAG: NUDIX domain-containing protein [Planctomycetota bacterium]|nr:NUDIX domain-containing protein [Planctomycetota bacterium]
MTPELREAARALVLDSADRVLLVRFELDGRSWWATPGGGLEPGETHEAAVRRELAEEVGFHDAAVGACVWTREHTFSWDDRVIRQRERFHLVRVEAALASAPLLDEDDLRAEHITRRRWWTLPELLASREVFGPRGLARALAALLRDGPPDRPLDVGV